MSAERPDAHRHPMTAMRHVDATTSMEGMQSERAFMRASVDLLPTRCHRLDHHQHLSQRREQQCRQAQHPHLPEPPKQRHDHRQPHDHHHHHHQEQRDVISGVALDHVIAPPPHQAQPTHEYRGTGSPLEDHAQSYRTTSAPRDAFHSVDPGHAAKRADVPLCHLDDRHATEEAFVAGATHRLYGALERRSQLVADLDDLALLSAIEGGLCKSSAFQCAPGVVLEAYRRFWHGLAALAGQGRYACLLDLYHQYGQRTGTSDRARGPYDARAGRGGVGQVDGMGRYRQCDTEMRTWADIAARWPPTPDSLVAFLSACSIAPAPDLPRPGYRSAAGADGFRFDATDRDEDRRDSFSMHQFMASMLWASAFDADARAPPSGPSHHHHQFDQHHQHDPRHGEPQPQHCDRDKTHTIEVPGDLLAAIDHILGWLAADIDARLTRLVPDSHATRASDTEPTLLLWTAHDRARRRVFHALVDTRDDVVVASVCVMPHVAPSGARGITIEPMNTRSAPPRSPVARRSSTTSGETTRDYDGASIAALIHHDYDVHWSAAVSCDMDGVEVGQEADRERRTNVHDSASVGARDRRLVMAFVGLVGPPSPAPFVLQRSRALRSAILATGAASLPAFAVALTEQDLQRCAARGHALFSLWAIEARLSLPLYKPFLEAAARYTGPLRVVSGLNHAGGAPMATSMYAAHIDVATVATIAVAHDVLRTVVDYDTAHQTVPSAPATIIAPRFWEAVVALGLDAGTIAQRTALNAAVTAVAVGRRILARHHRLCVQQRHHRPVADAHHARRDSHSF